MSKEEIICYEMQTIEGVVFTTCGNHTVSRWSSKDRNKVTCLQCLLGEPDSSDLTIYPTVGMKIGDLIAEKRIHYGDSFNRSHEIIEVLYPDGIPPGSTHDLLAITRIVDKLFRIANRHNAQSAGLTDKESPWRDIAGYALLAIVREEQTLPSKPKKEHNE